MPARNLEITFTGLIAFVPDDNQPILHVLLPHAHAMSSADVHKAVLEYPDGDEGVEEWRFDERFIDLSGVLGASTLLPLPGSLANAGPHDDCVITDAHVSETLHANVHAAIRLSAPTDLAAGPTVLWEFNGKHRYLTNQLKCIWAGLAQNRLEVTMRGRNGQVETREIPREEDGWRLHFRHLPDQDPDIPIDGDAHHFMSYYTFCGGNNDRPLPKLKQKPRRLVPDEPGRGASAFDRGVRKAANTFTCMLAQAPLGS